MNGDTKRKIDNARDVLVGKIPDPKAQVEQITLALIYRFMDYMDRQAEEWGGSARFFTNGYEKYAWSKLMDPRLGGFERRELYVEAIEGMSRNPHLPQLFRDIFKDAYLPYRDAETLRLFLKEIDGFPLDHTEDLGDAYEHLLSIMSSQGNAGQFRTPRHIIKFIVDAVDPKKEDGILDPACGTAGFLIHAYQHILEQNKKDAPGDMLTPDDRAALVEHFVGYDISPDMVRLSLVNMYLHGFAQPNIHEYDALTNEERWDDSFDVIMANPPFMTPKGGIRPHKRFSVQANRSEVLFVDYIAEHLKPSGRAGVIVPEGIIFTSSNAYKALRRMLVEDRYLYAVISLPAGVFQPYSGVKTSILLMDRELAKRTEDILFVKVENDGFDLGAQRRAIEANDLPAALEVVAAFKQHVLNPSMPFSTEASRLAHTVPKAKIAASGDYNFSGDRYRETVALKHQKWPLVELGEVCEVDPSKREVEGVAKETTVSFVPMSDLPSNDPAFVPKQTRQLAQVLSSYTYFRNGDVLIAKITPCFENGKAAVAAGLKNEIGFGSTEFIVLRPSARLLPLLLYRFAASDRFQELGVSHMTGSAGQQRVPVSFVKKFRIPLPPLEVQEEIVAEVDGYQKVIDGSKQVIAAWKPTIPVDPDWPMVELGEVCETQTGGTPSRTRADYYESGSIPWVKSGEVAQGLITHTQEYINETALAESSAKIFPRGTVLVALYGATVGQTGILGIEAATNQAICGILPSDQYLPEFLYYLLRARREQLLLLGTGGAQQNISQTIVRRLHIPRAPLEVQEKIVAEIEEERKAIEENKKLIELMEKRIKAKIAEVWGE